MVFITAIVFLMAPAASAQEPTSNHWAYARPVRPPVPSVRNGWWVRTPVDAFVAAGLENAGLKPRPEAPRAALLRRLSLDLVGLPPTPEETRAFVADPAPDAYERAVDRLLADPRHGERWGRHWMDVWRYSDWAGYGKEIRTSRPHLWRWRDWIVESLNADLPYDRMIEAMLAGDELAPDDPGALRATGFLARNWYKFNRNIWIDQAVEHTAKAFLGLTIGCARCHDHKYDPIAQEEYYRFRAYFEPYEVRADRVPGQIDAEADGLTRVYDQWPAPPTYVFERGDDRKPLKERAMEPGVPAILGASPAIEPVKLPRSAIAPHRRAFVIADDTAAAEKAVAAASAAVESAQQAVVDLTAAALDGKEETRRKLQEALERLPVARMELSIAEARRTALAAELVVERLQEEGADATAALAEALAAQKARALAVARRDRLLAARASREKLDAAEKAVAAAEAPAAYVPRALPTYPAQSSGRRLALARWIASSQNPLTARVAVNHVWRRRFGAALVPTVFEFGAKGRPPSHPQLLDWLACELVEGGWSLKRLHRLLVTSAVYRTASTPEEAALAADPDNRLYWRTAPRRMEAELVRDGLLFVAGSLDPARGGPDLDAALGLTVPRRSLYFRHANEKQMEFLMIFDAAAPTECYERAETTVPHQALALFNSSLALDQSRKLARALPGDDFVGAAFERVLGRAPTAAERAECDRFLSEQAARLSNPRALTAFPGEAGGVPPSDDPAMRAREDLVLVLFNHDEFVTIR
jgi:hypothetical protein